MPKMQHFDNLNFDLNPKLNKCMVLCKLDQSHPEYEMLNCEAEGI